jgi:hypothetical protein
MVHYTAKRSKRTVAGDGFLAYSVPFNAIGEGGGMKIREGI